MAALQMCFSAPYWRTLAIINFHPFSLQQSTWDFAADLCSVPCATVLVGRTTTLTPLLLVVFFLLGCMAILLLPIWIGALKVQGTGFVTSK